VFAHSDRLHIFIFNRICKMSDLLLGICSHLFDELRIQQVEFTVRVSFLEIYNEELSDLLSPKIIHQNLELLSLQQRRNQ
jgi:hypothetical protein